MTTSKVHLLKRPAKLPSGRRVQYWTLRWADRRGRQRYQSLGRVGKVTRAQAEAAKREMIVALATGKARQDKPCRMTLSAFVDFHEVAFGQGKRPTTLIEWRTAGNHAVAALDDKPIAELTWADASEIRAHLKERSDATVRKTLKGLRAMFARAVKRGMMIENPLADEHLGGRAVRAKRIFSTVEVEAMIDGAPSADWAALILLAHTSGLRKAELLHLRWADLDERAGTVRVERHHEAEGVLPWEPKTPKSTRTVPIPPATVAALLRLQVRSDSGYLFVSAKRLQVIEAKAKAGTLRPNFDLINNFTRHFDAIQRAAAAALGADWPHGCFHDLRKTFATRAAANGVPMHELQAHLGHSSITTTAEHYTEVEATAADRLRAVFADVA